MNSYRKLNKNAQQKLRFSSITIRDASDFYVTPNITALDRSFLDTIISIKFKRFLKNDLYVIFQRCELLHMKYLIFLDNA